MEVVLVDVVDEVLKSLAQMCLESQKVRVEGISQDGLFERREIEMLHFYQTEMFTQQSHVQGRVQVSETPHHQKQVPLSLLALQLVHVPHHRRHVRLRKSPSKHAHAHFAIVVATTPVQMDQSQTYLTQCVSLRCSSLQILHAQFLLLLHSPTQVQHHSQVVRSYHTLHLTTLY